jgi:hypothetical protein
MKRLTLSLVLLFAAASTALAAQQIVVQDGDGLYDIQVLQSDLERTVIHYAVNAFTLETIFIDGREYSVVDLDKRAQRLEQGLPGLPTLRESIVIPDDAAMGLRILEAQYVDLPGIDVAPSKGNLTRNVDPELVRYTFADFYGENAWYPAETARLDEPYIMRDTRGVVIEVNPFAYNPKTHTLRVYTGLTVEVAATGPGTVNVLTRRPAAPVDEFERIYERHFLNYDQAGAGDRYASVPEGGCLLVIAHDSFLGAMQPFVDWKNQMGIETTMVAVSAAGATGAALKSYVQNKYDTDELCYVLLVGDAAQVPYLTWTGAASDPSLALLAGTDSYPEAFIGRLSATTTAEVTNQITKFIEYERDAQAGADWYKKGTGIASSQGAGIGDDGEADWVHENNIRTKLLAFTYNQVDQIYDTNGGTAAMVTTAVNYGRSIMNYTGHGYETGWSSTGFSNTHVNALVNDNKLPFIVSVACVNGAFMNLTCFAEAWLRASHNGEPSGAVGMYASTINQSWAPPMSAQDEVVDLMIAGAKRSFGGLCFNGSCQMMDEYGSTGQTEYKCWTIFGDPTLRVRTNTPTAMSVTHDDQIMLAATSFTVNAEAGALVGLSNAGAYLGSAIADAGGVAIVPITGSLPDGEITVTVSSFNRFTYIGQVDVLVDLTPVEGAAPAAIALGQNHPNPFNPKTTIGFALPEATRVALDVYSASGQHVARLQDGFLPAGQQQVVWNGTDDAGRAVGSGVYFYRLQAGAWSETKKMLLLK